MIVSHAHRFVFIHVPKAAGSSVRRQLLAADPSAERFEGIRTDPRIGPVHDAHPTLAQLRDGFPRRWRALEDYVSFATLREPRARFASAVGQWLWMRRQLNVLRISRREFDRHAHEAMELARSGRAEEDPALVVFTPQTEFLFLDGVRRVTLMRPVERMDLLARDLRERTGMVLDPALRANTPEARGGGLRTPRGAETDTAARRLLRRALPAALREPLRRAIVPPPEPLRQVAQDPVLRAFVDDHYAADAELHAAALEEARRETTGAA